MKLILASTSSGRQQLLQRLGHAFESIAPQVDETPWQQKIHDPKELSLTLAKLKAQDVWQRYQQATVIGGDQVAEVDGKLLGKPLTEENACAQLQMMSGKTHRLWTAVSMLSPHGDKTWVNITEMTMRKLSAEEILRYVQQDSPLYCAGSYKWEERGIALFSRIKTDDPTAIQGLPLMEVSQYLTELGYRLFP